MNGPLLEHPSPDFAELERVLMGEQAPERVYPVELLVDAEVMEVITERYLGETWIPLEDGTRDIHCQQRVRFYHRLGYDFVPIHHWPDNWLNAPATDWVATADVAELSRGERTFVATGHGLISTWEEFEQFPWDDIQPDFSAYEPMIQCLPDGMKIVPETTFYQTFVDTLFGYDGFAYLLFDNPEMIAEAVDRWGKKTYDLIESIIGVEQVGALFHADDMGYKTNTFLSRDTLRQYILPWLKKFAALAHAQGKMFWLHCCGNVYRPQVIEDLLDDVQIDAFHSFEDVILPVSDFKDRYGDRAAALGGIDVDKLCRMDEASLREHIRGTLDHCMPGGQFALGSGNTVTNYTPIRNYLILLEEGRRWRPSS